MSEKLLALKLMLDALGESPAIDTIDDRKRVQKAVYLGQAAGVNLGYGHSWYLMGPYSPSLARDYYQLAEDLQANPEAFEGKRLRRATKLSGIINLMNPPEGPPSDLSKEDWLELLASYHYLRKVSGQAHPEALKTLQRQKNHLAPYATEAKRALTQYGLL